MSLIAYYDIERSIISHTMLRKQPVLLRTNSLSMIFLPKHQLKEIEEKELQKLLTKESCTTRWLLTQK